jgi:integrase
VRSAARHFSLRTEDAYVGWIRRFILFHAKRHPLERGAASTQNQARCALLFLCKAVLEFKLEEVGDGVVLARRPERLPVVLTRAEVRDILAHLEGPPRLVALLLYGAGLRLLDALRLRVHDVEFERNEILVRDGKGQKDRITMLPAAVKGPLAEHLLRVRDLHQHDLAAGHGSVYLPDALERKYPDAARQWGWQYAFPAAGLSRDPRSGLVRRHHLDPTTIQKAMRRATAAAGVLKHATPHTAALVRDPPARRRLRHPHDPGAARPQRRLDDHDLHPRSQSRRPGREEPRGSLVS